MRKRRKRGGILKKMTDAIKPQKESIITIDEILTGKSGMSQDGIDRVQAVWDAVMITPEKELINEARGYGYPLKSLVDFYIKLHEGMKSADFDGVDLEGMGFAEAQENNLNYLKACTTWDEFQWVSDSMQDAPPEGNAPFVPHDMVMLIIDKRIEADRNKLLIESANELPEADAIAFLNAETMRKHRDMPVETAAHIHDMPVEAYQFWVESLENRADQNTEMRTALRIFKTACENGIYDKPNA